MTGINEQTVTNAKIRLYNTDAANAGGKFYHVSDDSWQEETVTWDTAPTADPTSLASLGAVSINTWYEVDVTSLITGDGTYSLRISDSTGGADYSSKEGANAPQLVLTLGGTPAPTNTPTPGPSPTPTNTPTPTATSVATNTPTATATAPAGFNSATFVYDGDGRRVKSTINGVTTTFVGAHYEVTNGVVTKYYYAGAQRIAMRTNGTLSYLLGDHLGSTSLVADAAGNKINEQRYKAWGETRYASGSTPTKYQYTGQFSYESDFGLYFYNARWYDPVLGRFAQADTIIPQNQGVQAWDRYAYTNNNPIRYTDPSGHCAVACAVVVSAAILSIPMLILPAFGKGPDILGVDVARVVTGGNSDAVVTAGLAVQSQYPLAIFFGAGRGWAQAKKGELAGENPYSPSVAEKIMDERITTAKDNCKKCTSGVDNLIVAAIAQNAYELDFGSLPENPDETIDWKAFFDSNVGRNTDDLFAQFRQNVTDKDFSTDFMLKLYIQDLRYLMKLGYELPEWAKEEDVKYIEDNYLD